MQRIGVLYNPFSEPSTRVSVEIAEWLRGRGIEAARWWFWTQSFAWHDAINAGEASQAEKEAVRIAGAISAVRQELIRLSIAWCRDNPRMPPR